MAKIKRVFIIVLDSFGVGELPDAASYGDEGSNTIAACAATGQLFVPNMAKLGLFAIEGVTTPPGGPTEDQPTGCYGRLAERSAGKDTTTGHWELMGLTSHQAMPTYPQGFPPQVLEEFSRRTGRGVLCNKPYSGTDVIRDYGEEHLKTGKLIVYTSADSVFQIAAHEGLVPLEELYEYCTMAREILQGEHAVGRVIARPFEGEAPFARTANRRDFSLIPPQSTLLDLMMEKGLATIGVGKISDIFAAKGVSEKVVSHTNDEGMAATLKLVKDRDFNGLCFINLVDFDMKYGHRNDALGYAQALSRFDRQLGALTPFLRKGDVVMITADHGCDPSTPSTDHSREYIPLLAFGEAIKKGVNLGTLSSFGDIAATVGEIFGVTALSQEYEPFNDKIMKEG